VLTLTNIISFLLLYILRGKMVAKLSLDGQMLYIVKRKNIDVQSYTL